MHGRAAFTPTSFRSSRTARAAAAFVALVAVVGATLVAPISPAGAAPGPVTVTFTFDNQWSSQMTAAAALKAHGMAGTFYVISGWIGSAGFLSLSDLQTLAADGNEIGGKTVNNANLTQHSDAEDVRELCQGRNVLMADGFQVTDFAYPFAELTPADEPLVQQCGFNSGRGVGNLNNTLNPLGCKFPACPYAENIPPDDPYNIKTPDDGETTTTLAEMESVVTSATANGGGWLPFSFHQICDVSTPGCDPIYSVSPALFNSFLDWLQTQAINGVTVKTVAQVIGGPVQPAVVAPTVPPAPIGTNALVNPTLVTPGTVVPTNPLCWTPDSYGTNTPTFAWSPTGGVGGGGRETVTMSNRVSGDAKLLTTWDLGECAPTSVSGDAYQLTANYTSTVPVFFTVYGRSATGTWSYWTQSPYFPASATSAVATWRSPPVPATVQALSFGLTIDSNGTLTTSDYSLVDQGAGVPPAAPVGVNALANPLLATPDGSGANPACWGPSGFGNNAATFTWSPAGGQTGSAQETINLTSWTDGDAKLLTTFDNGNCAPTVTAGHVYTASTYYKSTVPVFLTLYSRDSTTGVWGYWTQTTPFPAASNWTLATFTAPVVPANVNGASFGMAIAGVGTLSTSNYSLVDTGPPALTAQAINFIAPTTATPGTPATLTATGGGSGNPVVFSVDPTSGAGVCAVSGTNGATLTLSAVGSCVIDANQAGSVTFAAAPQVTRTITVSPAAQTITFTGPGTATPGTPATLTATGGGSGNPVVFSVDPTSGAGVCAVSGTNGATLTLSALGSCVIDANQAGSATFTAAPQITQTITVSPAAQTISFPPVPATDVSQSPLLVSASASSGLPVTFTTTTPAVCTTQGTNGATIALLSVGSCIIWADQAGNATFAAAPAAVQVINVGAAPVFVPVLDPQSITFDPLTAKTLAQSPVTVSATASSGLPVTFTTATPGVCTAGGTDGSTITLLAPGTCTITAFQNGDWTYNAAPVVNRSFAVTRSAQTIRFTTVAPKTMAQSPWRASATASSRLPVTLTTSTPTVCRAGKAFGRTILFLKTGTCALAAHQAGNTTYSPARTVTRRFKVSKATQKIAFPTVADKTLAQSPVTFGAAASSGLTVTFTTTTPTVCKPSRPGATAIMLLGAGTCTVGAHQRGNNWYNAAATVTRRFNVSKATQNIALPKVTAKTLAQSPLSLDAAASSGLPPTFTTTTPKVCKPAGTDGSTITLVGAGMCTVMVDQAGDDTYDAAPTVRRTFKVSKAIQTITFPAVTPTTPAAKTAPHGAATVTVTATASSGLPVTFTTTTPAVCTAHGKNGASINLIGPGRCTVEADQPGDAAYDAAPTVSRTFTVS